DDACHGGMYLFATTRCNDLAHGRTSSYFTSDIGATMPPRFAPPGRWHTWQFSCRMGSTSRVKVTSPGAAKAGTAINAAPHAIAFVSIRITFCISHYGKRWPNIAVFPTPTDRKVF